MRLEEAERECDEARAEVERLRASRLPDVEYARLDVMWQTLVRERDEARACLVKTIADVEEARTALGAAWLTGGVSLAEGIRRKTAALENLR